MTEKPTSVKLFKPTRDRLKTYGIKGESFDDLVNRILDRFDEDVKAKES